MKALPVHGPPVPPTLTWNYEAPRPRRRDGVAHFSLARGLMFAIVVLLFAAITSAAAHKGPCLHSSHHLSHVKNPLAGDDSSGGDASSAVQALGRNGKMKLKRETTERGHSTVITASNPSTSIRSRTGDETSSFKFTPTNSISRSADAKSTSSPTAATPGGATASPLPTPFDNTPSSAFQLDGATDSCPKFMSDLLANPTFQNCHPLSLMLQTSTGFFDAEKTLLGITHVLDASCRANSALCATFLDEAARNLTQASNCKQEVDANLTLVMEAYNGLKAFQMLYAATCLIDPGSNEYCFASAVTNLTTSSNNYLYFMPYGLALPNGSTPSCSSCTQLTMGIFHSAASDRKQLIAGVYEDAAHEINAVCGANFVNNTLPAQVSSAASVSHSPFQQMVSGTAVSLAAVILMSLVY